MDNRTVRAPDAFIAMLIATIVALVCAILNHETRLDALEAAVEAPADE